MKIRTDSSHGGFTLTEVIVTLVIIAILAAILIPSLVGYINKAREKSAVAECRAAVVAAQTTASELYSEGKCTPSELIERKTQILALAELSSELIEINCPENSAKISTLILRASNGKYVLYENGTYTVSDEMPSGYTVIGYHYSSQELLSEAIKNASYNNSVWNSLRELYKKAYGGVNPSLSATEKNYLSTLNVDALNSLTWKPTLLGTNGSDGIMMIASLDNSSPNNAYMIYYNGEYYRHDNGSGKLDSAWVSDQGKFDVTTITAEVSQWKKVG